jgi:hypothetical protein
MAALHGSLMWLVGSAADVTCRGAMKDRPVWRHYGVVAGFGPGNHECLRQCGAGQQGVV